MKIISNKTAALFLASAKIGSIITEKENKYKDALESYGKNLGLTFQIADDTLDYNSELKFFGKKIGNDFYEGKVTLPIILLFQKLGNDEKKILSNMFKKELRTKNDFNEIIALINKYKIIHIWIYSLNQTSLLVFSQPFLYVCQYLEAFLRYKNLVYLIVFQIQFQLLLMLR